MNGKKFYNSIDLTLKYHFNVIDRNWEIAFIPISTLISIYLVIRPHNLFRNCYFIFLFSFCGLVTVWTVSLFMGKFFICKINLNILIWMCPESQPIEQKWCIDVNILSLNVHSYANINQHLIQVICVYNDFSIHIGSGEVWIVLPTFSASSMLILSSAEAITPLDTLFSYGFSNC